MIRKRETFSTEVGVFVDKVLNWCQGYDFFTYFNPNDFDKYPNAPFRHFIAVGCYKSIKFTGVNDFDTFKKEYDTRKDWLIGYLGYDLKNQIENLKSENDSIDEHDDIFFYIPEHIIHFSENKATIESLTLDPTYLYKLVNNFAVEKKEIWNDVEFVAHTSKKEYLKTVSLIKEHILNGDLYEMNYCIAYSADNVDCTPLDLYLKLNSYSPTPFSVFQRINHQYLICASPERFIKKAGNQLISQPIKGTISRGATDKEDLLQKEKLQSSEKERSENIMIVDLVRNDLAKSSVHGSVHVSELFGVYPFEHLYQMISTVMSTIREDVHPIEAIKNAFPMGSMTGAPKVMAMQLIENYENTKRCLFSGSVGYITPDGDFDFNVVIRSIFYNTEMKKISYQVGSAITHYASPEYEYDECLLKAKAINEVIRPQ